MPDGVDKLEVGLFVLEDDEAKQTAGQNPQTGKEETTDVLETGKTSTVGRTPVNLKKNTEKTKFLY